MPIKERAEVLRQEFRAFCASKEKLEECYATARKTRELEWEQQVSSSSKMFKLELGLIFLCFTGIRREQEGRYRSAAGDPVDVEGEKRASSSALRIAGQR